MTDTEGDPSPDSIDPTPDELGTLRQHAYRFALGAALLLLGTATVVYHYAEDWSWVDSFYFSSMAATTVGFGDFTPTTDASKLFTVFYVFAGMALITAVLAETLRRNALRVHHRRQHRD